MQLDRNVRADEYARAAGRTLVLVRALRGPETASIQPITDHKDLDRTNAGAQATALALLFVNTDSFHG